MQDRIDSQKLIEEYLDSIYVISNSASSVRVYRLGIRHFIKFLEEKHQITLDELIQIVKYEDTDPYKIINEFVVYLSKNGKKPSSIKIWITGIKGFLRQCGIKIYSEDFRMIVKLPKQVHQREEPLTKEIILRVINNVSPKLRTIILVLVASGMRIGETIQLSINDIDFQSNPTKIRIRGETTKTKESRETFLTSEATNALKDYLTRYFEWKEDGKNEHLQNTMIFGSIKKARTQDPHRTPLQTIEGMLANSMKRHLKNVPELSKINGNGIHMIHFHAFRKFFRTVVGNTVGRDFAEALIGHHFYLDTYYNLPEEKKRELYLKAEPLLTISDFSKIERDLVATSERQEDIEKKYRELTKIIEQEHLEFPKIPKKYLK